LDFSSFVDGYTILFRQLDVAYVESFVAYLAQYIRTTLNASISGGLPVVYENMLRFIQSLHRRSACFAASIDARLPAALIALQQ
jgi:hypothetical protein